MSQIQTPGAGRDAAAPPAAGSGVRLRAIARGVRGILRADGRADALHEWRRRWSSTPELPVAPIHQVLVLCHGNICRSPFAAALLARSDTKLQVRSAGLFTSQGSPPDPQAAATAAGWQIDLSSHRTHCATERDLEWAQLILVMQGRHLAEIGRRLRTAQPRTRILGHYLEAAPHEIADPWGQGEEAFLRTFAQIDRAVEQLAQRLAAQRERAQGVHS